MIKKIKEKKKSLREVLKEEYEPKFSSLLNITRGINNKSKTNPKATFKNLYSLLYNPTIYMQALGKIRPNKGSSTPGIDTETLDKMEMKKITNLVTHLKNKTFKFRPLRRVYIPKPNSLKKRPLSIPTFTDRIVQASIKLILESIYEPKFEAINANYGFRPGKSVAQAIKFLSHNGTACHYAIEGDIVGAFNNVNIKKLINILRKTIKDEKFIALIKQGCLCGMLDFGKKVDSLLGIPQGGISSPILFNIYMHEFDLYVTDQLNKVLDRYNKKTNRSTGSDIRNPDYINISYQIEKINKKIKKLLNNNKIKDTDVNTKKIINELIKEKKDTA